jgi:uncharacterized YigZ family protein
VSGPTSYLTVAGSASVEIEVKRSRFLGTVAPAPDEAAARAVVAAARRAHPDARHHCSAFVVGPDAALQRSSDDGEPAGTAGAPMLEVLRGHGGTGVSDTVAVVTRWFGGVLLGAGGLVRAYGDAVREALDAAGTRTRVLLACFDLTVDHADAGRVENELRARAVTVLGVDYGERALLHLAVPAPEAEGLRAAVAAVTAGSGDAVPAGERWH